MTNEDIISIQNQAQSLNASSDLFVADTNGMALICHVLLNQSQTYYESSSSSNLLSINMCTANLGTVTTVSENRKINDAVKPGTVVVLPPLIATSVYLPKINMLGIAICLDTFNHRMACDFCAEDFLPSATMFYNDSLLTAIIQAIWKDAQTHNDISPFFDHGIAVILKRLITLGKEKSEYGVNLKLSPHQFQNVTDFIESKVSAGENITVEDMAKVVDLAPRTFCRAFSESTGFAPYAYCTHCRIKIAQRLLCETNLSITAIANELGYSNASKFSFIFKKNIGLTPSEWRKSYK